MFSVADLYRFAATICFVTLALSGSLAAQPTDVARGLQDQRSTVISPTSDHQDQRQPAGSYQIVDPDLQRSSLAPQGWATEFESILHISSESPFDSVLSDLGLDQPLFNTVGFVLSAAKFPDSGRGSSWGWGGQFRGLDLDQTFKARTRIVESLVTSFPSDWSGSNTASLPSGLRVTTITLVDDFFRSARYEVELADLQVSRIYRQTERYGTVDWKFGIFAAGLSDQLAYQFAVSSSNSIFTSIETNRTSASSADQLYANNWMIGPAVSVAQSWRIGQRLDVGYSIGLSGNYRYSRFRSRHASFQPIDLDINPDMLPPPVSSIAPQATSNVPVVGTSDGFSLVTDANLDLAYSFSDSAKLIAGIRQTHFGNQYSAFAPSSSTSIRLTTLGLFASFRY